MNNPKISIIVPIYNVEKYLPCCMDSLLNQTLTDIEIILVDDGSPDDCGKICDEYATKDSRVKVIHKKNGGLSDARNIGIDIAIGEYFSFVDSDDWIDINMYETLYNNLVDNNADIACCAFYKSYKHRNIPLNIHENILLLNSEQAIKHSISGKYFTVSAWGKLYKKYIFDNIRYPYGKLYEDAFVIIDIFSKADRIVLNTISKYYYRQRKSSIWQSIIFDSKSLHHIEAHDHILNKTIELKYGADLLNLCKVKLLGANMGVLSKMVLCEEVKKIPEYEKIIGMLKKNFKFLIKNKYSSSYLKVGVLMLKLNIVLFKWFVATNMKRTKHKNFDLRMFS